MKKGSERYIVVVAIATMLFFQHLKNEKRNGNRIYTKRHFAVTDHRCFSNVALLSIHGSMNFE
jgi:hypothetical protein